MAVMNTNTQVDQCKSTYGFTNKNSKCHSSCSLSPSSSLPQPSPSLSHHHVPSTPPSSLHNPPPPRAAITSSEPFVFSNPITSAAPVYSSLLRIIPSRTGTLSNLQSTNTTFAPLATSLLPLMNQNTTLIRFTFDEIKKATSSFAGDNIIGKGGYGNVYKGVLFDGTQVALKRFKNCSVAGDASFTHEVEIALGTAKGLAYLHYGAQPSIIHRDIKASNILLDHNFEAKVADFGIAKFNPEGMTHMSTRVAGTKGYVAPEYALYGQLTDRSDVFSFGVVLLELFSGKKALHVENDGQPSALTDLAWSLVRYGETLDVIEDGMPELGPTEVLEKYVLVAVQCCHPQLYARPTMDQGVKMLETEEVEQPISCIAGRTDIDEKSVASN
ncbi:hypothetical protein JHK87_007371 [Glycine soja]|nr:hypothetical protein JHK87_007371 [Glycine soja]